jgi:hypothetical protein
VRDDLERDGDEARARLEFDRAFRAYTLAAQEARDGLLGDVAGAADAIELVEDGAKLWMKAARALQMSENLRVQAGTWESLGNLLGHAIRGDETAQQRADRYATPPDRADVAQFAVIADDEWLEPKTVVGTTYRPRDERVLKHQRAWAYQWAGEAAEAGRDDAAAARLYRRAAVAWEKSDQGDGLRRAARAYHEAAIAGGKARRWETRRFVENDRYCPSCLREKRTENACPTGTKHETIEPSHAPGEALGSDVERLERCWEAVASLNGGTLGDADHDELCRQLTTIQRQLATSGDRAGARRVFRRKADIHRRWLHANRRKHLASWSAHTLGHYVSRNGSSGWWFVGVVASFQLLVMSVFWWWAAPPAIVGAAPHGFLEGLTFSVSSMVSLSNNHFGGPNWWVTCLQSAQAIATVVTLGYVLWISQRSYAD